MTIVMKSFSSMVPRVQIVTRDKDALHHGLRETWRIYF
ncbi:hypothetical protein DB30_03833 [Enhygromyxa salina]|uniref:Uncharacterized protein n=1 Tax=Enhygromyxa salina TaxID=215803 RepID=A0A0C2DHX6_9BACT|nr:hypothetical protein DB30_03833 [Enhygromyxa salina]